MEKKLRHQWDKDSEHLKNDFTTQHQCIKCGVYRHVALRRWFYSFDKITNENPYNQKFINNPKCKP